MSSTNVRIRGKIRHEEWPKIAARFESGDTLAEIARSYGCTPPAIRYIVGRASANAGKTRPSRGISGTPNAEAEFGPAGSARGSDRGMHPPIRDFAAAGQEIWGRINNDIASFLAAMDALFTNVSDRNYEALLKATDRLLWASARTRLELERVIGNRREGSARKRLSA